MIYPTYRAESSGTNNPRKATNPHVFTTLKSNLVRTALRGPLAQTRSLILCLYNPGESRLFDFDRYELSKMLPQILEELPRRGCYQTTGGNFFSIEMKDKGSYEIYFRVDKVGKGRIKLFVQSAYLRDPGWDAVVTFVGMVQFLMV